MKYLLILSILCSFAFAEKKQKFNYKTMEVLGSRSCSLGSTEVTCDDGSIRRDGGCKVTCSWQVWETRQIALCREAKCVKSRTKTPPYYKYKLVGSKCFCSDA